MYSHKRLQSVTVARLNGLAATLQIAVLVLEISKVNRLSSNTNSGHPNLVFHFSTSLKINVFERGKNISSM